MTCHVQMSLPGETIFVAQSTNLQIGVISEVVHITQLSSVSTIIQAASVSGELAGAQDVLQTAHITMQKDVSPPSPLRTLARLLYPPRGP